MTPVWGIHNDTMTTELVEKGFISLGWDDLGDLRDVRGGREGFKKLLLAKRPNAKVGAIPGWAGILLRFRDTIAIGDVVVAPYKPDSTINIGVVTGEYEYVADEPTHRHRRRVEWKKVGLSRTIFTQAALYEVGSAITLFSISKHADEFLAAMNTTSTEASDVTQVVDRVASLPRRVDPEAEGADEPRASRIERQTRDYVAQALHTGMSHEQFEEFTADLLRAMGYQARVTQYSQDGGVDVLAHKDVLGLEPPLIKVQCKHTVNTIGAPAVHQLVGTQGPGETSLFVTLGTYSKDATSLERQRPGLRLFGGEDIISLFLEHYDRLPTQWRALVPLTRLLVIADDAN